MPEDNYDQPDFFGFTPDEAAPPRESGRPEGPKQKPLNEVARRAIKASTDIVMEPPEQISYQHTVLCQTSLPYRNPGKDVRRVERKNGNLFLEIDAGRALNPRMVNLLTFPCLQGLKLG